MVAHANSLSPDTQCFPRVSIVMPTYRRAHAIQETVQSVLDQTYGDFELLIRDDGSCHETESIVAAFHDSRVRYHPNDVRLGMPQNLNAGIHIARGEYVLVCHDHDLYDKTMVEQMVRFLDAHPTALFVHCGIAMIKQNGLPSGRQYIGNYPLIAPGRSWLSFMLQRFDCPVCANSMVRRKAYKQYGLYDVNYGFIADVEMWMRLSLYGDVGYIAKPLIEVRERESDHEYSKINWMLTDTIIRIHSLYNKRSFHGWYGVWRRFRFAMRADRYLLRQYIACLIHRDLEAVEAGRKYLQQSGVFVSRLAAKIV